MLSKKNPAKTKPTDSIKKNAFCSKTPDQIKIFIKPLVKLIER